MSDTPTLIATDSADSSDASIFGPMHLTRAMIAVVAVIFAFIFKYAAQWLHWPREIGFGGSLAQQMALPTFGAVLVLLVICTLIGTACLGRRWFLAGLMTATTGLATWSVRGGPMTQVLFNAENSGSHATIFLQMLGELIVFFGVIGGLWNVIWIRRQTVEPIKKEEDDEGRSAGAALGVQMVLMAAILLILAITPMKKQLLTSVFIAGLASTAVAQYFFANRSVGRWYWLAPLVVGAAGYVAAYFNSAGMDTGDLQGMFAPLARALPLDYASLGCAGVLFGYWWMEPEADDSNSTVIADPLSVVPGEER